MRKNIQLKWEHREWVMACVDFYRDLLSQLVKKATDAKKFEQAQLNEQEAMNLANIQQRLASAGFSTVETAEGSLSFCNVEFEEFEARAVYNGIDKLLKKLERMVKDARMIRKDHVAEEYSAMAEGLTAEIRPLFGAQLDLNLETEGTDNE